MINPVTGKNTIPLKKPLQRVMLAFVQCMA